MMDKKIVFGEYQSGSWIEGTKTKRQPGYPDCLLISKNLLLLFSFLSSSLRFCSSFLLSGFDFLGVGGGAFFLPCGRKFGYCCGQIFLGLGGQSFFQLGYGIYRYWSCLFNFCYRLGGFCRLASFGWLSSNIAYL